MMEMMEMTMKSQPALIILYHPLPKLNFLRGRNSDMNESVTRRYRYLILAILHGIMGRYWNKNQLLPQPTPAKSKVQQWHSSISNSQKKKEKEKKG